MIISIFSQRLRNSGKTSVARVAGPVVSHQLGGLTIISKDDLLCARGGLEQIAIDNADIARRDRVDAHAVDYSVSPPVKINNAKG